MALGKNKTSATIVVALLAAAVGAVHMLTGHVNESLATLTIEKIPSTTAPATPFDTKSWLQTLAPVVVERGAKVANVNGIDSVDALFKAEPAPVVPPPPAPAPPDFPSLLAGVMRVESIAGNGAFINGKFYSVGEAIKDFEYPLRGRPVVPVIVEVGRDFVIVKHGSRLTELKA